MPKTSSLTLLASFLTFAALVSVSVPPALGEITVTHPNHYANPPKRVTTKPAAVPGGKTRLPPVRPGVLVRSDEPLGSGNWNLDKVLSGFCREGEFVQRRDRRYIAVLDGRTYGAATASRRTLHDPHRVAAADTVYVFKGQGTSRCRVYHRGESLQPLG